VGLSRCGEDIFCLLRAQYRTVKINTNCANYLFDAAFHAGRCLPFHPQNGVEQCSPFADMIWPAVLKTHRRRPAKLAFILFMAH
jgi:hypothetical protein